jgi:HD-like signal output (HDOD) protein
MPTPASTPDSAPSQAALDRALDRLRSADDFPAVSGRVQQLMDVLGDEDASVQQLTNLIIQDYSMTVKLLKMANAFQFNRSNTPLVSVTHAIFLMGVQAVRELASSIVVFEHFQRRSPGLRQLLMLSLLSANHAREVAGRSGMVRAEEAYLLGMLRNLGEVLVACYFPEEYTAVLNDMAETRSLARVSCRRILQFEYEELATAVVRDWHMSALSRVMSEPRNDRRDPSEAVVSFAHDLTSAVYRHASAPSHQAVTLLMQKYVCLGLKRDDVAAVLEAGVRGTSETFAQARVRLDDLQLKHQMAAALVEPHLAEEAPRRAGSPHMMSPADLERSIAEVYRAIEHEQLDLNKMILMILEATLSAGGFDRAMLALVAGSRREICGRLGLGMKSDDLIRRFRFVLGVTGGPVGTALSRAQELMVAKSWELLPEEQLLMRQLNAGALVMLPLVVDGRLMGALYVDTTSTAQPGDAAVNAARQMRDAVLKAMRSRKPSLNGDISARMPGEPGS